MEKKKLKDVYGLDGIQDQYEVPRSRLFSSLFHTLKDEGIFSRAGIGDGRKKFRVYFPAANTQRETIVFNSLSNSDEPIGFIGGDMVEEPVRNGKNAFSAGGAKSNNDNTDFVVADGFHTPFKDDTLGAIVDIAGAAWYALDGEKAADNLKSIFHEWHRVLEEGGRVILDDFHHYWPNSPVNPENYSGEDRRYESTMHRIGTKTPELFEDMVRGEFRFQTIEGDVMAFKTRELKLKNGNGWIYIFEK